MAIAHLTSIMVLAALIFLTASTCWTDGFKLSSENKYTLLPRDVRSLQSHPTAFVASASSDSVAASLFYSSWKKRRCSTNNSFVRYECANSHINGAHRRRSTILFMSVLDQPDHDSITPILDSGAALAASDTFSRSTRVIHSLQGGSSTDNNESNPQNMDGGAGDASSAEGDSNQDIYSNSNDEHCGSNNVVDETSKMEGIILIHTYPYQTNLQINTSTFEDVSGKNATSFYENAMLVGIGMSQRQFSTWVHYHLSSQNHSHLIDNSFNSTNNSTPLRHSISSITNQINTQQIDWENDWEIHLSTLKEFWREERLVCEHTSLLSPKRRTSTRSNSTPDSSETNGVNSQREKEMEDEEESLIKSENFRDALSSYADRMVSIVHDEMSDIYHTAEDGHEDAALPQWKTFRGLLGWIEQEYGMGNTNAVMASSLLVKSEKEQLEALHSFLEWFRSKFPYYHDKCDECGRSCKDDPPMATAGDQQPSNVVDSDQTDSEIGHLDENNDEEEEDVSFIGYLYPSTTERLGNASRTELYRCRSCDSFTRFPRYNKALWVTSMQRGRCGEYSMLLYRMLRAMGYEKVRWVVDWADHVWCEVWLNGSENGRWVHCDPCEASVDEPLLYQGWGKNQTYIVAFYDPFKCSTAVGNTSDAGNQTPFYCDTRFPFPLIEDVTSRYTSAESTVIAERRGITNEFLKESINQVSARLTEMLQQTSGLL